MKKKNSFYQFLIIAALILLYSGYLLTGRQDNTPQDTLSDHNAYSVTQEKEEIISETIAAQNDSTDSTTTSEENTFQDYSFRNTESLEEHFGKHGAEFGYTTPEEYVAGANRVIADNNSLHKTEAEDGDDIYYLEATNEIVFVSPYGFIRTYFKPTDGIKYFNRQ